MSAAWRPDDSLLDINPKGESKGGRRVRAALRKHGVRVGRRIVTSRDTGMSAARNELKRTGMPKGFEQWQLPIPHPLENLVVMIGRMKPNARVERHSHKVWVFRYIIQGSLKIDGKTLRAGDWMLIPPGVPYELQAGPQGCTPLYAHCLPPPPPPPGPPGMPGMEPGGAASEP